MAILPEALVISSLLVSLGRSPENCICPEIEIIPAKRFAFPSN
jgi:hypothetical protein